MGRDTDVAVREAANRIAVESAVDEVVGITLAAVKNLQELWHQMTTEEQDAVIQQADTRARALLRDLSSALGSGGFARIKAQVDSVALGKLNVAKLIVENGEDLHLLCDLKGAKVTIVHATADSFLDAQTTHKADADDKQLDLLNQLGKIAGSEGSQAEGGEPDEGTED